MKQFLLFLSIILALLGVSACDDSTAEGIFGSERVGFSLPLGQKNSLVLGSRVQFSQIDMPLDSEVKPYEASSMIKIDNEIHAIGFTKLMKTGDVNNGETFGALRDDKDCDANSSGLNFTSILEKNNKLFMLSQFGCSVGALYMAELEQDPVNGALSVKPSSLELISQKDMFGGPTYGGGQTTPWDSHLGAEKYTPKHDDETAKYWKNDSTRTSAYYYGWTAEVSIDEDNHPLLVKHYAMGRFVHEAIYVMPDQKTVYMSEDGTNAGFYMFIADAPADLSAGTLYAAKLTQTDEGKADLSWIKLAHSDDATLRTIIDSDNNIFNTEDVLEDGTCPTLTSITTTAGHECLSIKSGQERAAAFLETSRYSALMGATIAFKNEGGITYDVDHKHLYMAMGALYALDLKDSSQVDINSNLIDSEYVFDNMYRVLDTDTLSNPTNISYLEGSNILSIGAKSLDDKKSVLWAYDVENGALTRTFTVASEIKSLSWYRDIKGYGYQTVVTQDASDEEPFVGVFGPFDFGALN